MLYKTVITPLQNETFQQASAIKKMQSSYSFEQKNATCDCSEKLCSVPPVVILVNRY